MLEVRRAIMEGKSQGELRKMALLSELMCPACVLPLRPQIVGAERQWLCLQCRKQYRNR